MAKIHEVTDCGRNSIRPQCGYTDAQYSELFQLSEVNDPDNLLHSRWPWAQASVEAFANIIAPKGDSAFPCVYASATVRRETLYFVFAESTKTDASRYAIRCALRQYLEEWKKVPKTEEHLHVLVMLFAPEDKPQLADHHLRFWELMNDWQGADLSEWPNDTPKDPEAPYWSMCFAGVQLFINVSSPAHVNRHSRNLGPSLALVVQPRQSFDIVAGPNEKGDRLRDEIRQRVDNYDQIPSPKCLGTYGKGDLEWPQYALQDSVAADLEAFATGCPMKLK